MTNLEETPGPAASPRRLSAISRAAAAIHRIRLRRSHLRSRLVSAPAVEHRLIGRLAGVLLASTWAGLPGSLLLPKYLNPRLIRSGSTRTELGIAVFGIIVLFAVPVVGRIYTSIAGTGQVSLVLRAIVAGICLLPPTLLMGATLPAIALGGDDAERRVVARIFLRWQSRRRGRREPARGLLSLRVFDMPTATAAAVGSMSWWRCSPWRLPRERRIR